MSVSKSGISWTDSTWSPIIGCTRVSEGCRNCFAERNAIRMAGPGGRYEGLVASHDGGPRWTGVVKFMPRDLDQPLRWKRPRRIFVNPMSDLFHEGLSDAQIAAVFGVMALAPQHTFQVLTKRPRRMLEWFDSATRLRVGGWSGIIDPPPLVHPPTACVRSFHNFIGASERDIDPRVDLRVRAAIGAQWPLPNVWVGVSAEDQATLDARMPDLLRCPAKVRWVSLEPQLGPVDLRPWLPFDNLQWVVQGGESGPRARPFHPGWAVDVIEACKKAGVPYFFKQQGAWKPKSWGARAVDDLEWGTLSGGGKFWPLTTPWNGRTGDDSDDREEVMVRVGGHQSDPAEWPEAIRVQDFPA